MLRRLAVVLMMLPIAGCAPGDAGSVEPVASASATAPAATGPAATATASAGAPAIKGQPPAAKDGTQAGTHGPGTALARPMARDLAGREVDPFGAGDARAVVLIFVRTDCPISNRYAPEMQRLEQAYRPRNVAFWLVYPDPDESIERIRGHLREYGLSIPVLRDVGHRLVAFCGATKTPEAAVFLPGARRAYRGRIDDRNTDFGKSRAVPNRRDLEEAISAVLSGRTVSPPTTEAVGCFIPELDP